MTNLVDTHVEFHSIQYNSSAVSHLFQAAVDNSAAVMTIMILRGVSNVLPNPEDEG